MRLASHGALTRQPLSYIANVSISRKARPGQRPWACFVQPQAHAPSAHPLVSWVRDGGGDVWQGVTLQQSNAGMGLFSNQACSKGQKLVSLRPDQMLTFSDTTAPSGLMDVIERIPASFWALRLAMRVLEQRALGAASPHATYIEHLPASIMGLPMFFPPDAVEALWYPPLKAEVERRGRFMSTFHRDVLAPRALSETDPFHGVPVDLSGVGWALAVVTSRAFATLGPGKPRSMLPLIDMCNHSFSPNCNIDKAQDGVVSLVSTRNVATGEQLLMSYGQLDSHTMLLDYGFMQHDNPFDNVALKFDMDAISAAAQAANGITLNKPGKWQKERLVQLRLLGASASPAVAVGRGSYAHGSLPLGVEPRLLTALQVMLAPSSSALKPGGRQTATVECAALALLLLYLQLTVSNLGLDAVGALERLQKPGVSQELTIALKLCVYKAVMLEEVTGKIEAALQQASTKLGMPTDIDVAQALRESTALLREKEMSSPRGFGGGTN